MTVYCRSCRARHKIVLTHGQEMTRCHGMWWFVDRHPRTARVVPITGATKLTRGAVKKLRVQSGEKR